MVDPRLIDYIRNAVQKGFSLPDIGKLLQKHNYSQRDIDEALWIVNKEMMAQKEQDLIKELDDLEAKQKEVPEKKAKEKPAKEKKGKKKKKGETAVKPEQPEPKEIPPMPEINIEKEEAIPISELKIPPVEIEKPSEVPKKSYIKLIVEVILSILLFAFIGVLMYIYMWPALLKIG